MKKKFLLLPFLLLSVVLFAQKVKIDDDKLTVDGAVWCSISEEKSIAMLKKFSFTANDGTILLTATPQKVIIGDSSDILMLLHFNNLNKSFYYQPGIGMKKVLCNQLVKSGALTAAGIDATGVDKFEFNYGYKLPNQALNTVNNNTNSKPKTTIVERNRSANIFVINGQIKQDFKLIASYQQSSRHEEGKLVEVITFLDVNGLQIAQASFLHFNPSSATYYLTGDEHAHSVALGDGTVNMQIEAIVKHLIATGNI